MTADQGLFPATDLHTDLLGTPGDDNDMLRTAWLSDDGVYRWSLRRTWGSPDRLLPFIMLNPSTADALIDDPTIRRCIGFAREMGYDGIHVVNLYAYRATDPKAMWAAQATGIDVTGGVRNNNLIRDLLTNAWEHNIPVIAAWGAGASPDRVAWILEQSSTAGPDDGTRGLTALRVTKQGHPGHPLYLPATCRPLPWPHRSDVA